MDLTQILPELIIIATAILLLIVESLRFKHASFYSFVITITSFIVATLFLFANMNVEKEIIFNGAYVIDVLSVSLKMAILMLSFLVFLYSKRYLQEHDMFTTEYFALGLFAVLGMMVMASSASLLTLYIGLELMSLSLYAMVAYLRKLPIASEAAIKYFVLGAIASGMLLYGMSFIYGITGSLELSVIADKLPQNSTLSLFAMVFIISGILFKLGAAPFHMWLPDVYQGSATATTIFISTAPKVAGFALVIRLLVDGLGGLVDHWQQIFVAVAILSIILGNTIAISQTNLKRMFAYSGIAHSGFFLLGILSGNESAYAASMFYILVYAITTLGGFGIIILLSNRDFEAEKLSDYKGLAKRHPWYAFLLMILLFSMAGVPPTVGFYAKLSVLSAIVAIDLVWVAVIAVLFAIVGAFYYLRVVVYMYFSKPEQEDLQLKPAFHLGALSSVNALTILALGIFPAGLMSFCLTAVASL